MVAIALQWLDKGRMRGKHGGVSIERCRLTSIHSIGIPKLKTKRSRDRPIFNMGIPILGKTVFILRHNPDSNPSNGHQVAGPNLTFVSDIVDIDRTRVPLCICHQMSTQVRQTLWPAAITHHPQWHHGDAWNQLSSRLHVHPHQPLCLRGTHTPDHLIGLCSGDTFLPRPRWESLQF